MAVADGRAHVAPLHALSSPDCLPPVEGVLGPLLHHVLGVGAPVVRVVPGVVTSLALPPRREKNDYIQDFFDKEIDNRQWNEWKRKSLILFTNS